MPNNYGVRGMSGYMARTPSQMNGDARNEGMRLAPGQRLPPEFYGVEGPDEGEMPAYDVTNTRLQPVTTVGRGANRLALSDVHDAAGKMAEEGQGLTPIGDGSASTGYVNRLTGGLSLAGIMAYPQANNPSGGPKLTYTPEELAAYNAAHASLLQGTTPTAPVTVTGQPVPGNLGVSASQFAAGLASGLYGPQGQNYGMTNQAADLATMASQANGGAPNRTGNTDDEGHNIYYPPPSARFSGVTGFTYNSGLNRGMVGAALARRGGGY